MENNNKNVLDFLNDDNSTINDNQNSNPNQEIEKTNKSLIFIVLAIIIFLLIGIIIFKSILGVK